MKKNFSVSLLLIFSALCLGFAAAPRIEEPATILTVATPLVLLKPADNLVTTEAQVVLSGLAQPDIAVTINHAPIYVDEENNFSVEVPLAVGKNLIRLEGRYQGKIFSFERRILRKEAVVLKSEEDLASLKKIIWQKEKDLYDKALRISAQESNPDLTPEEAKEIEEQKYALIEDKKEIEEQKSRLQAKATRLAQDKNKLEVLSTLGLVKAAPDKKFALDKYVIRAELAIILVKAKDLPLQPVEQDVYPDVPKDHWAAAYIKAAVSADLMQPLPNGKFAPLSLVTRTEGKEIIKKLQAI